MLTDSRIAVAVLTSLFAVVITCSFAMAVNSKLTILTLTSNVANTLAKFFNVYALDHESGSEPGIHISSRGIAEPPGRVLQVRPQFQYVNRPDDCIERCQHGVSPGRRSQSRDRAQSVNSLP